MFSLHIDTSRNWTGGSNQVMYTVMGLRARRERAALVAHPDGELFRRMSEGTDLIPLAPDHEIEGRFLLTNFCAHSRCQLSDAPGLIFH